MSPAEAGEQGRVIWIPRDQELQRDFLSNAPFTIFASDFSQECEFGILSGPNLLDGYSIPQFKLYLLLSDHFSTFYSFNKEDSSAPQIVVFSGFKLKYWSRPIHIHAVK